MEISQHIQAGMSKVRSIDIFWHILQYLGLPPHYFTFKCETELALMLKTYFKLFMVKSFTKCICLSVALSNLRPSILYIV